MSDCYTGEIRLFAGNYAPENWCVCDGRLLKVADYGFLYALIGTTFGGDGKTTFAVPDLRGRIPVGNGTLGSGGSGVYALGQQGGAAAVTLTIANLPAHTHTMNAIDGPASQASPGYGMPAIPSTGFTGYATYAAGVDTVALSAVSIQPAGASQAHTNLMPTMALTYIIALTGEYPGPES